MRILLALDDSKYSAGATDALIAQAKTENAEVHGKYNDLQEAGGPVSP